jgi:hypothetical protein
MMFISYILGVFVGSSTVYLVLQCTNRTDIRKYQRQVFRLELHSSMLQHRLQAAALEKNSSLLSLYDGNTSPSLIDLDYTI